MKKEIVGSLLFVVVLFSGCSRTASPQAYGGKYYMTGDSVCMSFRQISDNRIMCYDSDGKQKGWREAMSDQELQMYYYNKAEERAAWKSLNQTLQQTSNQMRQNAYNTQQSANELQELNNQMYQRKQDKQLNYQFQQMNNNLNGIRYGY